MSHTAKFLRPESSLCILTEISRGFCLFVTFVCAVNHWVFSTSWNKTCQSHGQTGKSVHHCLSRQSHPIALQQHHGGGRWEVAAMSRVSSTEGQENTHRLSGFSQVLSTSQNSQRRPASTATTFQMFPETISFKKGIYR
uniref:Uncharacterized protein n=1 Tax=Molossus molossus TaxID=27622 RepID=A0A7J8E318_MOLMO|nr:hypothetical protein HJG59_009089 [Molossus molossus]